MEAFKHVVNIVFQVSEGLLYKALEKSADTSLTKIDIDSLTYDKSETDKDVPLSRSNMSHIHIFVITSSIATKLDFLLEIIGCLFLQMIFKNINLVPTLPSLQALSPITCNYCTEYVTIKPLVIP